MFKRKAVLLVGGAAILALGASVAVAQDTTTRTRPTSSQRISIRKDQGGEVQLRVDTVYSYRTDTLRLPGRTDTVVTTNTITRVDTVRIPIPQVIQQIGGLYFGFGAGAAFPAANFNDSDKPGWRVEGMVGIDPIGSWFGARLSGGYNRYTPHGWVSGVIDDAQMWNAALDAKFRMVAITPFSKRVQIYGIAGGTWNRFRNILETNRGIYSIGDNLFLPGQLGPADDSWHSGWGYNLGGGAEFGWGRTNLFVETRYSNIDGRNSRISNVPLIVGLSWF